MVNFLPDRKGLEKTSAGTNILVDSEKVLEERKSHLGLEDNLGGKVCSFHSIKEVEKSF